jgi:uncharacterized protein
MLPRDEYDKFGGIMMYRPTDEDMTAPEAGFRPLQAKAPLVDDHPNAKIVWEAHTAFQAGDVPKLHALLHPDVIWHWPGNNILQADLIGPDAVIAHFDVLLTFVDNYWAQGLQYFGGPDFGVLVAYVVASKGERKLQVPECLLFRMLEGRIAECWHMALDERRWDAFFSPDNA